MQTRFAFYLLIDISLFYFREIITSNIACDCDDFVNQRKLLSFVNNYYKK